MADADESTPLPGIMPSRVSDSARAQDDFNPIAVAKDLLRTIRAGALATIDRNTGHPFSSLVNVAADANGSPLILISRLAAHTANIEADPRASVLLAAAGKGDPLAHPRLTVLGAFRRIERGSSDAARAERRFLSHHPKSRLYAGFGDFSFWRMQVVSAHLNGGFARARDLTAAEILTAVEDAAEILDIEETAISDMNADHADAVRLYATRLLGEADGAWTVTGIDPDGIDLALGDHIARIPFPRRVTVGHALRKTLEDLAVKARGRQGT
jgi:putative heme iron utilization protein